MRKRRIYLPLLLLGIVALVAALVGGAFRKPEPQYNGKKLSDWMVQMNPMLKDNACEAVQHIGSNAVPYLLEWIAYDAPPWRYKLSRQIGHLLGRFTPGFIQKDRKEILARGATLALSCLGQQAGGAIGELANDPNGGKAGSRAAHALANLGKAGLPPLLTLLTNEQAVDARKTALQMLQLRPSQESVPLLVYLLGNPDWQTRSEASNALRIIQDNHSR